MSCARRQDLRTFPHEQNEMGHIVNETRDGELGDMQLSAIQFRLRTSELGLQLVNHVSSAGNVSCNRVFRTPPSAAFALRGAMISEACRCIGASDRFKCESKQEEKEGRKNLERQRKDTCNNWGKKKQQMKKKRVKEWQGSLPICSF